MPLFGADLVDLKESLSLSRMDRMIVGPKNWFMVRCGFLDGIDDDNDRRTKDPRADLQKLTFLSFDIESCLMRAILFEYKIPSHR